MNDNPPTYTPLVLLQSSWRKIRRPSRETISTLFPVPVLAEVADESGGKASAISDEARESNMNKPTLSRKTEGRLPLPEMGTDSRGGENKLRGVPNHREVSVGSFLSGLPRDDSA